MELVLNKVTDAVFSPVFVTWLLMIVTLVAQLSNRRRLAIRLNLAAVAVLWLTATGLVSRNLVRSLEMQNVPSKELRRADAIIVLAGVTGKQYSPQPVVHLGAGADRLLYAATLYEKGLAPLILFCGNRHESAEMEQVMEMLGVPRAAMVEGDTTLSNTYGAARDLRDLLVSHEVNRALLVTSAIRMPRALAVFKRLGVTVIPAPTDFASRSDAGGPFDPLAAFLPNITSLNQFSLAMHEFVGLIGYSLVSWI